MELTVHDEDVHEEIALEPFCESSDTITFASQIVDKPCDELELVHSSSPTVGVHTVMTGKMHEVQGNDTTVKTVSSYTWRIGKVYTYMR